MNRSTPKPKFFSKKRDFFLFLLVLAGVAVLFHFQSSRTRVTISGLGLDDTRKSVASQLGGEDFRHFSASQWEEHWYKMEHNSLNVTYDQSESVHKIEGGIPEIDGVDASHWSLEQIQAALGPPALAGLSRAVGEKETGHLSYPQHRVLIYLEPSGNRFVLFESGRR